MKVLILAGGSKSTISDEKEGIPKPMIEIGGRPLLWHIMKSYSYYGFNDFLVCGGYKLDIIKKYFMDYYIYQSDITVDLFINKVEIHKKRTENWKVTVLDTGLHATTVQRVIEAEKYIDDDMFIVTYGDSLSNINLQALTEFAGTNGKLVTMAVAKPTGRNQVLSIGKDGFLSNEDGINTCASWTNACTYIFRKEVFSYLDGNCELDKVLFPTLVAKKEVAIYKHHGFWCPVETKRDKVNLENQWNEGVAPWKMWKK